MRRVAIVTDCKDVSFNEMCGAIHREADAMARPVSIEPVIPVENFSEINAAFLTRLVAENYPAGTVIYTVVTKTNNLRSTLEVIWGETLSGHLFVGPNFGYFGWLARDLGVKRLFELRNVPQSSFSGKTYIAPIVARIAAGDESETTRYPCNEDILDDIDLVEGTVVHIDNFGNVKVKTNVGRRVHDDVLDLSLNGRDLCEATYIETQIYLQRDQGRVVLYRSTSFDDMTDLGMVRGNFAQHHGVRIGDVLTWREPALRKRLPNPILLISGLVD